MNEKVFIAKSNNVKIEEGDIVKGGINQKPSTPRPPRPPHAQNSKEAPRELDK